MSAHQPRMYSELASWWPLLSPPSEYVEEAADMLPDLLAGPDRPPETLLELGCGGGSLASHLKTHFRLTLSDLSDGMLDVSRALNPECEHVLGDMRALDLGRTFDLVLVHDAIMYATDEFALRRTMATAARHCRPGGAVLLVPDCTLETFEPGSDDGGHDGEDGRSLRYLEWALDRDPTDGVGEEHFLFLLKERDGRVHSVYDAHTFGLFAHRDWVRWLEAEGLRVTSRRDPWGRDVFLGRKGIEGGWGAETGGAGGQVRR